MKHKSISCIVKKSYDTIDQANDAGKSSMYYTGCKQLYIYECIYCNKFHLTQQITILKVF